MACITADLPCGMQGLPCGRLFTAEHFACYTAEPELRAHACAGAFHKQRGAAAATPVTWRVLLMENL